jgi:LacI family transcriptional regulator
MERRPPATLHDVAREAGVSQATASRVLNGSARTVTPENTDRVRAAAARLGYAPDLSAQAVARGSTRTAALVVNGVDDPYFSTIAGGVIEGAEAAGLIVTVAVADRSPSRELEIVRTLRGMRPRAIILVGSRVDGGDDRAALAGELTAYRRAGGSVVLVSQPDLPFPTVSVDNYGGARRLALALAGRGYRRFALVRADPRIRTSRDRCDGFRDGLAEHGIAVPGGRDIETGFDRAGGYAAASGLAARGIGDLQLVFAVNDVMAIGAMAAFRDAGLTPGADIAVAGFDDIPSAVDVTPALTTVAVPLHRAGLEAVRLALTEPSARTPTEPVAPRIVPIPTEAVLRDSTP